MMISCWSKHVGVLLSVFSVWHFKLIFYYIEVHLLVHYIQWIKTHGEIFQYMIPVFGTMQAILRSNSIETICCVRILVWYFKTGYFLSRQNHYTHLIHDQVFTSLNSLHCINSISFAREMVKGREKRWIQNCQPYRESLRKWQLRFQVSPLRI
jgi:hypothetical protein